MDQHLIRAVIEEVVSQISTQTLSEKMVPIAVSARHCHLSPSHVEILFGKGYQLTKYRDLSQPGQFAANEKVTIVGPRGSIHNVRVLGPVRKATQVEVSRTDAIQLGIDPPLRESGDLAGAAPITIVGPAGSVYVNEGAILALAHIHMHPTDAEAFGVKNGEFVRVTVDNERAITFERVLIRVSPNYRLEMHIDTDEANAGLITTGQKGRLEKCEGV